MSLLNINIKQVESSAKNLEELSRRMDTQAVKRLQNVFDSTAAAWTGEAADTFRNTIGGTADAVESTSVTLQTYAEALRSIAAQARKAEAEAQRLAQL